MTINQIQDEIISEFSLLDGDMEMTVFYIMELGQKLPEMPESEKTDDNIVKGCQSKVWLTASLDEGRVLFRADSNTAITSPSIGTITRGCGGPSGSVFIAFAAFCRAAIRSGVCDS